ncbi:MAG: PRC-barrel domain-containing protein [Actinomycetota bacterium]|nr:PRC-barrel domain-containing protein [Actinomycetota bacterium]
MALQHGDRGTEIVERCSGYTVYDRDGDKIGKVDDLFVDERDNPEYLGVKMGLFRLSGTTLIPWEAARIDEGEGRIEVSAASSARTARASPRGTSRTRTSFGCRGPRRSLRPVPASARPAP